MRTTLGRIPFALVAFAVALSARTARGGEGLQRIQQCIRQVQHGEY